MKKITYEKQERISIGSDPELSFAIVDNERRGFYRADNFLSNNLTNQLGCDGCPAIAELRPRYSDNPIEHVNNIKRIMKRLITKMNNVKMSNGIVEGFAGHGFNKATGGHIHFSINMRNHNNYPLLKILDMMSIYLMPMEYKIYGKKRKGTGYGQLGAYETKSYGFEYRTPASWLYSENNTRSILCLAYTLAYEFMNNRELCMKMIKTFNNHLPEWNNQTLTPYRIAFKNCDYDFFKQDNFDFYRYFEKKVRKIIKYNEYKPYIENLFSFHRLNKKLREKMGLRKGWRNIKIMKNLFYFSTDDNMYLLNKSENNKKVKDTQGSIFVFGLKANRDTDISSNNQKVVDFINDYIKRENLNLKVEKLDIYQFNSIGLGYKLRKENISLIEDLLKYVAQNVHSLNLEEKSEYLKDEDFENEEAESDSIEEENEEEDDYFGDCENCGNNIYQDEDRHVYDEDDNRFCCIECRTEFLERRERIRRERNQRINGN